MALCQVQISGRDSLKVDETRRKFQVELDNVSAESNKLSKEIGMLFKTGEVEKANLAKQRTTHLKEQNQIDKLVEVFKKNPHIWDATESNFNALVRAEVLKEIKDASLVINSSYQFKNQEDN